MASQRHHPAVIRRIYALAQDLARQEGIPLEQLPPAKQQAYLDRAQDALAAIGAAAPRLRVIAGDR